jgi:hypothetical protein
VIGGVCTFQIKVLSKQWTIKFANSDGIKHHCSRQRRSETRQIFT